MGEARSTFRVDRFNRFDRGTVVKPCARVASASQSCDGRADSCPRAAKSGTIPGSATNDRARTRHIGFGHSAFGRDTGVWCGDGTLGFRGKTHRTLRNCAGLTFPLQITNATRMPRSDSAPRRSAATATAAARSAISHPPMPPRGRDRHQRRQFS